MVGRGAGSAYKDTFPSWEPFVHLFFIFMYIPHLSSTELDIKQLNIFNSFVIFQNV